MKKIAITGNIASGKSKLEHVLIEKGFIVFDTDIIVHDILIDKPDVATAFENHDVFEFGRLSNKKLGDLVFSNPELRKKLESIIHPLVLDEINQIFKTYRNEKYVFISIPLLFEVGWESLFDEIIFIQSNSDIRLNRLMARNNLSKKEALSRINCQMKEDYKIDKANYIINNNSTLSEYKEKIDKLITNFK